MLSKHLHYATYDVTKFTWIHYLTLSKYFFLNTYNTFQCVGNYKQKMEKGDSKELSRWRDRITSAFLSLPAILPSMILGCKVIYNGFFEERRAPLWTLLHNFFNFWLFSKSTSISYFRKCLKTDFKRKVKNTN